MVENQDFMKRKTYLFDRGSWLNKKEEVKPEVPSVFNNWDIDGSNHRHQTAGLTSEFTIRYGFS